MRLAAGEKIGGYEIVAPLGAGGMGEVYRARDAVLDRDVAIKIVNPDFCCDPESIERMRREARALAALNHPHVATIHELREHEGSCCLVMELVPGETLGELLNHRRLSVADAVRLAQQIASALEAAHERGIIHRDLKPANIKITPEGTVKVLDFGLAKTVTDPDGHVVALTTTMGTKAGAVVGTVCYMSPEQARGQTVDRRTDIWSLGCVLFEMLSSRRTFEAASVSETYVAILEREPEWSLLRSDAPPAVRRVLRRCLEKDAKRRFRDAGDVKLELEEALATAASGSQPAATAARSTFWHAATPVALVLALAIGVAIGALATRMMSSDRAAPDAPRARFSIALPAGERFERTDYPIIAISPDARLVTYVASRAGRAQLFLRGLDAAEATPIPGTLDAFSPFFSPDSRWIGFFADGKLKKVPVTGGSATTICNAADGFGATWGPDDTIIFSDAPGAPLSRVSAAGGAPARFTRLDAARGEFSHRWPQILPDGKTVLFTVGTVGDWDTAEIVAQSLESGERTTLVKGGTHPHYLPAGHLMFAHAGAMWSVPLSLKPLAVSSAPTRALDGVVISFDGAAQFSVAHSGTSVYVPANPELSARRLMLMDNVQKGELTPLAAPARPYLAPRVSPDGRKVLLTITNGVEQVWVYDITAGTLTQLTFDGVNRAPIWTANGRRVTYSSNRGGASNLFMVPADGSAAPERLTTSENLQLPGSWSADGSALAYIEHHPVTGRDIWILQNGQRTPFLTSSLDESAPRFSPDGRWIAYVSNEGGRADVYVRAATGATTSWKVSTDGGMEPVWASDGRTLFYRDGNRLLALPVIAGPTFRTGTPRVVTAGSAESGTLDTANYDVVPGTERLVLVGAGASQTTPAAYQVLLNWGRAFLNPTTP